MWFDKDASHFKVLVLMSHLHLFTRWFFFEIHKMYLKLLFKMLYTNVWIIFLFWILFFTFIIFKMLSNDMLFIYMYVLLWSELLNPCQSHGNELFMWKKNSSWYKFLIVFVHFLFSKSEIVRQIKNKLEIRKETLLIRFSIKDFFGLINVLVLKHFFIQWYFVVF